jgi:predicted outer membrane protein
MIAVAALVLAAVPAWLARDYLGFPSSSAGRPVSVANQVPVHQGHGDAAQGQGAVGQVLTAGPISDLDKELLVRVRQANLWELQAGRLAQENGESEAVKRAGLHLLDGHSRLDQIVREIAVQLQIGIPDEPTEEQQDWVEQLEDSEGEEFDRFFANVLRAAHGKVFVAVAQVRSTTQNSVIRDLAIEANTAVADHLQVLEDTGMVEQRTFDDVARTVIQPTP